MWVEGLAGMGRQGDRWNECVLGLGVDGGGWLVRFCYRAGVDVCV